MPCVLGTNLDSDHPRIVFCKIQILALLINPSRQLKDLLVKFVGYVWPDL